MTIRLEKNIIEILLDDVLITVAFAESRTSSNTKERATRNGPKSLSKLDFGLTPRRPKN